MTPPLTLRLRPLAALARLCHRGRHRCAGERRSSQGAATQPAQSARPGTDRASDEPRSRCSVSARRGAGSRAAAPTRRRISPGAAGRTSSGAPTRRSATDRLLAGRRRRRVLRAARAVSRRSPRCVSIYGLFAKASTINAHLALSRRRHARRGAIELISEQIARIASNSDGKLTFAFVFGLGLRSGAPMPA